MEDGVSENPAKPKETQFVGKAGWMKKGYGRFLASYKNRYVQVEKTEVVVYENEGDQNCLERVDLENYDKCQELKSAFMKKNRLILIRTPKSGNKVCDIKFQASSPEEKAAWIKAVSDGINRAKNKVFDEVRIDESSNLDHVTRTRPKGNRNRRPPTRIHMKETASVSLEGVLRLDLDAQDASTPNGTHYANAEIADGPKEAVKPPTPPSKSLETEEGLPEAEEPEARRKVVTPPIPPSKDSKPSASWDDEAQSDATSEKVPKPPTPPSKESKPSAPAEDATSNPDGDPDPNHDDDPDLDDDQEKSPKTGVESGPPTPPSNKPTTGSTDNLALCPPASLHPKPPNPPSKDKKPALLVQTSETRPSETRPSESGGKDEKEEEKEEGFEASEDPLPGSEQASDPESVAEAEPSPSPVPAPSPSSPEVDLAPNEIGGEPLEAVPDSATTEQEILRLAEHSPEEVRSGVPSEPEPKMSELRAELPSLPPPEPSVPTPEPIKKSPGPPTAFKKKPIKFPPPKAAPQVEPCDPKHQPTEETKNIPSLPEDKLNPPSTASPPNPVTPVRQTEGPEGDLKLPLEPKPEVPVVVLSLTGPAAGSPVSLHRSLGKREWEEEKSVDSGQHSDDDGEGFETGDSLAASTAALRGSQAMLDTVDVSDNETPDSLGQGTDEDPLAGPAAGGQTMPQVASTKVQSTFMKVRLNQPQRPPLPLKPSAKAKSASLSDLLSESSEAHGAHEATSPARQAMGLEREVALALEKTGELLGTLDPKESPQIGKSSDVLGEEGEDGKGTPEELLARAMEKLQTANKFLREAQSMKESKLCAKKSKRNSW